MQMQIAKGFMSKQELLAQQAAMQEQDRQEAAAKFCENTYIDELCDMMDRDTVATSVFSSLTESIAAWN